MTRVCKHQPAPTDRQREVAAQVKANGGNVTADELAHSDAFTRAASTWSRGLATSWIKRQQAEGKWLDAHCHGDGTIYLPRGDA